MARYAHHKYTYTNNFRTPKHEWSIICARGGLHFHAAKYGTEYGCGWSCGLEIHRRTPLDDSAPNHMDCWLLKAPCWHDGISLYAREDVWPRIEPLLRRGDHDAIFRVLEYEGDQYFYKKDDQP